MRVDDIILDDHQVIDRVMAARFQRRDACVLRIRDQRLHVGVIHLHADRSGELGIDQHLAHFLARLDLYHVCRRAVFGDVFIA